MKTRFSSLVKFKKDTMQKSERVVQKANISLSNALKALELSFHSLEDIEEPKSGNIKDFLASRSLLGAQREIIGHNQEWVEYEQKNLLRAKEQLKKDMIEFEKFNYLEIEDIKKEIKRIKTKEAKELDEIALMTYQRKGL
jgi:hypothetical protein